MRQQCNELFPCLLKAPFWKTGVPFFKFSFQAVGASPLKPGMLELSPSRTPLKDDTAGVTSHQPSTWHLPPPWARPLPNGTGGRAD